MCKLRTTSLLFIPGNILLVCTGVMAWQEYRLPTEAVVVEYGDASLYNSLSPGQKVTVPIKLTNCRSVTACVVGMTPC